MVASGIGSRTGQREGDMCMGEKGKMSQSSLSFCSVLNEQSSRYLAGLMVSEFGQNAGIICSTN